MSAPRPPFHLAFPVPDLEPTRRFFVERLGCRVGRRAERWIDFDFRGHQLTAHLIDAETEPATNPVDGRQVPARHFGLVLPWGEWEALARRFETSGERFLIEPTVRFPGAVGEQGTFFVKEPGGNVLEFKSFRDEQCLFATDGDETDEG
ncbi:MAG: VOC family protein [Acidobacteriota bacterium]